MTTAPPVRVLLVDDSRTARALLRGLCEGEPGMTVVGEVGDGRSAVEQTAALRPSIVVMDIEMPVQDGIEATRQIMEQTPTPILVVTAHHDPRDVALSLRAVQAGALSLAPKPVGPGSPQYEQDAQRFVRLVKALAGVRPVRRYPSAGRAALPVEAGARRDRAAAPRSRTPEPGRPPAAAPPADLGGRRLRAVGVAASTGGPAAVYRLLERLPGRLDVPVLVVQHIASGFAPGLADWLAGATPLRVKLAENRELLVPGTVYVAPDGRHLRVAPGDQVALSDAPPVAGFRPSASVLFTSLAEVYGADTAGVVLTGMGNDGLDGARALRRAGAPVLAQDADSSVVFGMPRAVTEAGLATSVGSVDELAFILARSLPRKP